jgi:hypothetical protein
VEGEQVWICEGVDPNYWQWESTQARLLDDRGQLIGTHTFSRSLSAAGRWTWSDGSAAKGDIIAREKVPNAVPRLLVAIGEHEGTGLLGSVETVRQAETKGGWRSSVPCSDMGSRVRIPFSAVHQFYGAGKGQ